MAGGDLTDSIEILKRIQSQASVQNLRLTLHAQQEMIDENIKIADIYHTIQTGRILENYPEHQRGACCLLNGEDEQGRDIHIVCTTSRDILIIITAYLPLPPKWLTPTQRG